MDKKWQDIHILCDDCYHSKNVIEHIIRQVKIKSIKNTDSFTELNVTDVKEKSKTIIIPKLFGVKVVFD